MNKRNKSFSYFKNGKFSNGDCILGITLNDGKEIYFKMDKNAGDSALTALETLLFWTDEVEVEQH